MIQPPKPQLKTLSGPLYKDPNSFRLENNLEVFTYEKEGLNLFELKLIFDSGAIAMPNTQLPRATAKLLKEGTSHKTSEDISGILDFYGASIKFSSHLDIAQVQIKGLSKHLGVLCELAHEILQEPIFPEEEIEIYKQRSIQNLKVSLEKVDILAERRFKAVLFGESHPYAYNVDESKIAGVTRDGIVSCYELMWKNKPFKMMYAGAKNPQLQNILNACFGKMQCQPFSSFPTIPALPKAKGIKDFVIKKDATQCSINIGKVSIEKTHPDFQAFTVINAALGGYFGSRLMSNIREEKGYTYGIYSTVSTLNHVTTFEVNSEVGVDVCDAAVEEIYKEIARLRTTKIPQGELDRVRNYMLGRLMRQKETPFSTTNIFLGLDKFGLNQSYIDSLVKTIQTVDSSRLMDLANLYWAEDSFVEVIAGEKN